MPTVEEIQLAARQAARQTNAKIERAAEIAVKQLERAKGVATQCGYAVEDQPIVAAALYAIVAAMPCDDE